MGAMLMTGATLACASLAIALIARSVRGSSTASRTIDPLPAARLAIVLFAFAEGIAVLSVVQGLLTIFTDKLPDPSAGLFAGVPALSGALVALAIVARDRDQLDSRSSLIGMSFIAGLGVLGGVVMSLAYLTHEGIGSASPDLLYVLLGGGSAVGALAVGIVGSAGMRALQASAVPLDDPATYRAAINGLALRCLPFVAVGWVTGLAASLLSAAE